MRRRSFIAKFIDKFIRDNTTTLAASLAFYTALSLAPLLILFVTVSGWLSEDTQTGIVMQVRNLMGNDAASAVRMIVDSATQRRDLSSFGSAFGLITLAVSASLIFGELRSTLNRIFEVHTSKHEEGSVLHMVCTYLKGRVVNIGVALIFVLSLIVSLTASSLITASVPSLQREVMQALDLIVSFAFYTVLFALVYRYLPDVRLSWWRAFRGGLLTSILFCIGKQLVGTYLGRSAIGSPYGAAGSIVVLLAWVYYLSLITFVGAQISALLGLGRRTA